jgi:hypothetical protein
MTSAAADTISVTAANTVGTSQSAGFGPVTQVVSGTPPFPATPANLPVPGDQVII